MAKAKSKKITLEKALVPLEEQPYEVPENWCWIKLGVISSIISKGTTPKGGKSAYVDEGIDFLRVENINDDGTICHDDMMHVTEETHTGFLKRSILEENDILVSIAGTLGKTAIVKNDDLPLNTNQAVAFVRLKDNGEVSREYIRYAIDTPVIQNMLLSKTKVTAIPNLTLEIISECLIPFPPLAEQQRIVEQIESLFSKLDEAKEKAQEVIDGYEAILQEKQSYNTNNFYGDVTGVQIQQGTVNSSQTQTITQDFDYGAISDIIENIKKYDGMFDAEFGDKASELRGKIAGLEALIEKRENPSKIKMLLTELRNLAIGVTGSLIASGIAAQIPIF